MWNRVVGIAVALSKSDMEIMDTLYNPNEFKIEEMYLKPTDLGPIYKPPIKALVYTAIGDYNNPPKFIFPSFEIYFEVSATIE